MNLAFGFLREYYGQMSEKRKEEKKRKCKKKRPELVDKKTVILTPISINFEFYGSNKNRVNVKKTEEEKR